LPANEIHKDSSNFCSNSNKISFLASVILPLLVLGCIYFIWLSKYHGLYFSQAANLYRSDAKKYEQLIERALKWDPYNGKVRYIKAGLLTLKKDYLKALEESFQASKTYQEIDCLKQTADLYFSSYNPIAGQEYFEKCLLLSPNDYDSLLRLGIIEAKRGDLVSAKQRFRTILETKPADPNAYFYLAVIMDAQKKYLQACAYFKTAYEITQFQKEKTAFDQEVLQEFLNKYNVSRL